MMSIFSSLDAVFAEYLGNRTGSSFALAPIKQESGRGRDHKEEMNKGEKEKISSLPAPVPVKKPSQQQRAPRFAPELDGLHCFETIVS